MGYNLVMTWAFSHLGKILEEGGDSRLSLPWINMRGPKLRGILLGSL